MLSDVAHGAGHGILDGLRSVFYWLTKAAFSCRNSVSAAVESPMQPIA